MAYGDRHGACARQRTIKNAISCAGTGLHSGVRVAMTLRPAKPGTGVVFRRTDLGPVSGSIEAHWRNVVDTRLNTTLGNEQGARIGTVEHLMAALLGCRIDNVIIDVDGPEIPIMDGSAAPFVFLVECAGTVEQQAPRRAIEILKPVTVGDDRRSATLAPGNAFSVSFEIDFDSPLVSTQRLSVDFANGAFRTEICRARTFGFEHEVAELRTLGYARGGSLDNAIVIGGDGILNEDGLRYRDEFVRHKILDCAGDLYLAGAPICGHFHGHRSGHTLNNKLLKAVFADASAWRTVTLGAADRPAEGDAEDWSPETLAASA